ncbi:MAG: DNA polymerase III subunit gamma/tau [Firmicutes bacterium]|nr:DNA polymerase III subunit gamma/tau [Bacillota bacterium]
MNTLALKYRPRLLSDLVGQEASVRALGNALRRAQASGGIHHQAFLFAGVRGTGKTSTARILARALNCVEGPTPTPCGVCDACLAAEQPDRNLDVIEIDAASRASVEDARALREQVQTRPAFCRYRVYIIDEVHMLSRSAFDALLKILEEPPAHAVFILATTELQDVPETIKSRVQIYPFRLIPVGLIESRLRHVCEQEGVTFDEGSLRLLAEAGTGSMRDALTTLDRVIAAGDGVVREEMVREQLGIVPAVRVQNVLKAMLEGNAGVVLDECQALASLGADWINFWRELMLAFRDRLESTVRQAESPQEILRLARMLQLLLQRERDLKDSSLPQVVVELALVTAAQLPHLAPLDALLRVGAPSAAPPGRPLHPESGTAHRAAATPNPQPGPASLPEAPPLLPEATSPPLDLGDSQALCRAVGDVLREIPGLPRTLTSLPHMANDLRFEEGTPRFFFPPPVRPTGEDLEREKANPHLIERLRQILPSLTAISLTYETQKHERPEDLLREDLVFQKFLQEIEGEILEVKRSSE